MLVNLFGSTFTFGQSNRIIAYVVFALAVGLLIAPSLSSAQSQMQPLTGVDQSGQVTNPTLAGRTLTLDTFQPASTTAGIGVVQENALSDRESMIANGIFGVSAVLAFLFCLSTAVRQRRMFALYVFFGACAAVPLEIFVDILGRCNWATLGQPIVGHIMGRDVPLLNLTNYMVYFPVAIVSVHAVLEKGTTLKQWWQYCVIGIALAWMFELYPVNAHWWYYYGVGQPLMFMGLPMWWGPAAVLAVMGTSAMTYLIGKHVLHGRHSWFMIFAIPLSVISIHLTASFPTFLALSSTDDVRITTVAALATIALALSMIHLIGRFTIQVQQLTSTVR